MLVSTVLCILLWKRYSARLLGALRQHQAMRQAPLQGLHRKLVRAGLRARLRRLEGGYRIEAAGDGRIVLHWRGLVEPESLPPLFGELLMRASIADQFEGMVREIERRVDASNANIKK